MNPYRQWYGFVITNFFKNFQIFCDQRQKNRTYEVKGRVDLSTGGWWAA